jgi:hypothetical protein
VSHDTSNENSPSTVEEQGEAVTQGVQAVLPDGANRVAQVTVMPAQQLEAEEGAFAQLTTTQVIGTREAEDGVNVVMAPIPRALQEEAREEVGREGAGEGLEAAREGARGRGSKSSMRAVIGSESTQSVHADTGVFSPPCARGGMKGGATRGGARGGARGRGRESRGGARGSARGGVNADTGVFSPPRAREGARAGREATREEESPAALTQEVARALRVGAHGGGARGSARGGVHADTGVFSPPRTREGAREEREAMREEVSPAALMQEVAQAAQEGAHGVKWTLSSEQAAREGAHGVEWTLSSKKFFELDQLRRSSGELLTVHPASNSLQVVPHQDCSNTPQADLILNMLLNINDEYRKVIIIKLVSRNL